MNPSSAEFPLRDPKPLSEGGISRPRRDEDVRKFAVRFACPKAGLPVDFGWTEVIDGNTPGEARLRVLQLECSGVGKPGCPIPLGARLTTEWIPCPRAQRLTIRLSSEAAVERLVAAAARESATRQSEAARAG